MTHHAQQDEDTTLELTPDDAVELGGKLLRKGHLEEAENVYRMVLHHQPEHATALHHLGIVLHRRGLSEEAIALMRHAIALAPLASAVHNNLGNVLLEAGRVEEAIEAYRDCIAVNPEHADAYSNLGTIARAQGRTAEATAAYLTAIELNPKHADAHNNMGNLLSSLGQTKEALAYYCEAITLRPAHPEARKMLGIAYYTLGRIEEAAQVYRDWLADAPGHPVAIHMLAACTGRDVPARAADDYIETTFDRFADSFDAKLGKLGYRAPEWVVQAWERVASNRKDVVALDAGCGTGLCGPLLRSSVHRLVGVDLSAQMLAKARARQVYDSLEKAELTRYLSNQSQAFDLIVSADTLVYFGPLEAVARAAKGALRSGGWLIFTVETDEEDSFSTQGYRINPHGRYSHSRAYVRDTLSAAGFHVPSMQPATLRMEGGQPVTGLVVSAVHHG